MNDDGKVLLEQLEQILERDGCIDEIGFVHPTQLATLCDNRTDNLLHSSPESLQFKHPIYKDVHSVQYNEKVFWHRDHKLAISSLALLQLYNTALEAYRNSDGKYKALIKSHGSIYPSKNSSILASDLSIEGLGNDVLRHSKALLILSCDFSSAWNSRKLVISRSLNMLFGNELQLSELILSYSPKSDCAWAHRRWVIRTISGDYPNFGEIIERESELVKKIVERTKMNYRAWNHRGYLVSYMSRSQVLEELSHSKCWAKLHVADSSCFHYRIRLMLRLLEGHFLMEDFFVLWKEELDWNQSLIEQFVGREALWMHRRFLLRWGLEQFTSPSHVPMHVDLAALIDQEMRLLQNSLVFTDELFEDTRVQAEKAASYLLWMWKHIPNLDGGSLKRKLRGVGDVRSILNQLSPEKAFLCDMLSDQHL